MMSSGKLVCILLLFSLALMPAQAATPSPSKAETKTKAGVKVTAKAKVATKARSKTAAKAKTKAKARAKAKPQIKATRASLAAGSPKPSVVVIADEAALAAEVAAARRSVAVKPDDIEARERLAHAALVLIDWLLVAESVGDTEKSRRLARSLGRDLHDVGWRVQKMAQKGDLKASQATGYLLGRGILLPKDAEKSCAAFLAAAEQLAPAGWYAAQCLMEVSPGKAWVEMHRAAERGHATAQEWMGRRCLGEFGAIERDYVCARSWLAQSASQGRTRSQTLFAYLLMDGEGGPVDAPRATRLYKLAAEHGDADAQNNLGEIYEMGRGTDRNLDEALRWYENAAARGLGPAQFNAGRLWAIGVGERKDPARARTLLVQAEGSGVVQARQVLDWLDRQSPPGSATASGKVFGVETEATRKD
ncbi:MAG: tetratricopeptide repeat protein [Betaproteobacteria bacterium]|nr:tetratricopeptide repeat protein [Betaproteobacteria bacterium]